MIVSGAGVAVIGRAALGSFDGAADGLGYFAEVVTFILGESKGDSLSAWRSVDPVIGLD